MSCYCKCSVALPGGAVGLSVVCDCGISCFFTENHRYLPSAGGDGPSIFITGFRSVAGHYDC